MKLSQIILPVIGALLSLLLMITSATAGFVLKWQFDANATILVQQKEIDQQEKEIQQQADQIKELWSYSSWNHRQIGRLDPSTTKPEGWR